MDGENDNQWFYVEDGKQKGPVSRDTILSRYSRGDLSPEDLIWRVGIPEWVSVVQEFGWPPAKINPPTLSPIKQASRSNLAEKLRRLMPSKKVIIVSSLILGIGTGFGLVWRHFDAIQENIRFMEAGVIQTIEQRKYDHALPLIVQLFELQPDNVTALRASYQMGLEHLTGKNLPVDYDKAVLLLQPSARTGLAQAQYLLALIGVNSLSTIEPPREWARWCEAAAASGLIEAQTLYGHFCHHGVGLPPDLEKALVIFRTNAHRGDVTAQHAWASMHLLGEGIEQDYAAALHLYKQAAEQGHADSQWALARLYATELAGSKDELRAFHWMQKAASQNMAQAQYDLAAIYAHGRGVPLDLELALSWYKKAAKLGHGEAAIEVTRLSHPSSSPQIEKLSVPEHLLIPLRHGPDEP